MEKKNTSSSSICRKFRQALASNPAFRSIHRIKQYLYPREPRHMPVIITHSNSPSAIPILFDYSTPTTMGNGNSATSMLHVAKVEPEAQYYGQHPTKVEMEVVGSPTNEESRAAVFKGKKSVLDINDTFTEYIQRAKCRIRTVSNVGKRQKNSTPDGNGTTTNKVEKENQNDHFSDFIQHAKKRFGTTSNIGNTSSSKRG